MGDSGGPLIQTMNEWKTVIGLTSFGPANCDSNVIPGVYTRVSSYIEWIKGVVERDFVSDRSLNTDSKGMKGQNIINIFIYGGTNNFPQ